MADFEDIFRGPFKGLEPQPPGRNPDLEEALERLKRLRPLLIVGAVLALGTWIALGAFFQVEPEEEALLLRFGKPTGEVYGPGLHTKIPWVDEAFVVPVERQHRIEFGFRSDPGKETVVQEKGFEAESLMLTGDLLLAHVRWSLIYRIDDIETWLFNIKDREETIRDIAMAIMRQLAGDYSLHEVLTAGVREIQHKAMELTQKALRENVPTGVTVTELAIRSTDVPAGARQAFDEFNRTEPDVTRQLAEAKAELHNLTGDAERDKKQAIGEAERRYAEVVNNANGEALAFGAKLDAYREAPGITRQWMYLATMREVLGGVDGKIIIEAGDTGSDVLKLLPLGDLGGPGRPAQGGTP